MCMCINAGVVTGVTTLPRVLSHPSLLVGEFPNEPENLHLFLQPTTPQNYAQTLKILHSNFS